MYVKKSVYSAVAFVLAIIGAWTIPTDVFATSQPHIGPDTDVVVVTVPLNPKPYTHKVIIDPQTCKVNGIVGVETNLQSSICVVRIDRNRYHEVYGQGEDQDFSLTSPDNTADRLVVELRNKAFTLFLFDPYASRFELIPPTVVEAHSFHASPDDDSWKTATPGEDMN